jgi:KDEL-tailed cysteine endopeptidase
MQAAVFKGPISTTVAAGNPYFRGYKGGILNAKQCPTKSDHMVAAVGYGVQNGQKFWIIRNSWGVKWGEKGYIRIAAVEG